jgi:hypothetical protein
VIAVSIVCNVTASFSAVLIIEGSWHGKTGDYSRAKKSHQSRSAFRLVAANYLLSSRDRSRSLNWRRQPYTASR